MTKKISEESIPVQELKTPTTVSLRRIMIVLLASFCVFVGVLIYQIYPSETEPVIQKNTATAQRNTSQASANRARSSVVFQGIRQKPAPKESAPVENMKPILTIPLEPEKEEPAPTGAIPEPTSAIPEPPAPVATEPVIEPIVQVQSQTEKQSNRLTIEEALQLRDALATGHPCSEELRLVMKRSLPDENLREDLIEHLMPICGTTSTWDELNNMFLKDKKDALMTYYHMTSSNRWVAYLKTVATMVVDVRRLNPVKQKPKDMISMAQNALMSRNITSTVAQLNRLPEEIKADFADFLVLAGSYRLAQTDVEKLILSFAKKEEK